MKSCEFINNTSLKLYYDVSKIPHAGFGIFTDEIIYKNQFIGIYDGKIVNNIIF